MKGPSSTNRPKKEEAPGPPATAIPSRSQPAATTVPFGVCDTHGAGLALSAVKRTGGGGSTVGPEQDGVILRAVLRLDEHVMLVPALRPPGTHWQVRARLGIFQVPTAPRVRQAAGGWRRTFCSARRPACPRPHRYSPRSACPRYARLKSWRLLLGALSRRGALTLVTAAGGAQTKKATEGRGERGRERARARAARLLGSGLSQPGRRVIS